MSISRREGGEVVEHAQDGGAASDVEDDLILEEVPVLVDCVTVAPRSDLVFLSFISAGLLVALV
jgi:hypothetical protein